MTAAEAQVIEKEWKECQEDGLEVGDFKGWVQLGPITKCFSLVKTMNLSSTSPGHQGLDPFYSIVLYSIYDW